MSIRRVESKAIEFARNYYRNLGYTIVEKSGRGCDLVITRMGKEYPIEVKGRTKVWSFINVPMQEYQLLKSNPDARLFEVILSEKTNEVEYAYEFCFDDFLRKRPLGYALYPNRDSMNRVYPKKVRSNK